MSSALVQQTLRLFAAGPSASSPSQESTLLRSSASLYQRQAPPRGSSDIPRVDSASPSQEESVGESQVL